MSGRDADSSMGNRSMRALALLCLALLVVLPATDAQSQQQSISITKSIHSPIDWRTVEAYDIEGEDATGGATGGVGADNEPGDYFTVTQERITFTEDESGFGQAEARITLDIPEGATDYRIVFSMDRLVTSGQVATTTDAVPNIEQEIQLYGPGLEPEQDPDSLFDHASFQSPFREFDYGGTASPGAAVGFLFNDEGENAGTAGSSETAAAGFGLTSTIKDAEFIYQGVPLDHEIEDVGTITTEGGSAIGRVASFGQGPREDAVLVLPLGTDLVSINVDSDDGERLLEEGYSTDISNAGTTITIFAPSVAREMYVTYSTTTASVQSTAVGVFGTATILVFIPLAVIAFIPLMKDRFNVEEEEE